MIEIQIKNKEPLEFEEAKTVKEAVQRAVKNGISLEGSDLSNEDLSGTNLSGADLSGTDLSETDLTGTYLLNADLSGANIDFSCLPLWCGSLNMKIDKKIFCQLLYHVLRAGKSVNSKEVKKLFSIPEIVKLANQFHRACECGKILQEKKTE